MIKLGLIKESTDDDLFQEAGIFDAIDKAAEIAVGKDEMADIEKDYAKKNPQRDDKGNIKKDSTGKPKGEALPTSRKIDYTLKGAGQFADAIDRHQRKMTVNTSSIISKAKNSIAQFPMYITPGIRVNEAHIINKSFERVYATFFQTVLSMHPSLSEEDLNGMTFLKQFHTNLREATEVLVNEYYEPIDDFDRMMCESIFYSAQVTDNVYVEFKVVPTVDEDLILEHTRLMNEPLMGFAYLREDMYMREAGESFTDVLTDVEVTSEIRKHNDPSLKTAEDLAKKIDDGKEYTVIGTSEKDGSKTLHTLKHKVVNGQHVFYRGKNKVTTDKEDNQKPQVISGPDTPKLLSNNDIKKINGMLPYTIEATFRVRSSKGEDQRDVKFVIGIKTVMHLISHRDLAEDLRGLITGSVKSLQKVRYKTGEISFKDYMFNIDGLKADAAKHINYDKRWLNTLKRLGEYKAMHGTLMKKPVELITGGDVPIPNGTLVISQLEVNSLIDETGINLSIVSNAKRLARTLFLIGIVIVDGTAGTMKVLFPDSDVSWDVQSLSAIDAELSKTDNSKLMSEFNKFVSAR